MFPGILLPVTVNTHWTQEENRLPENKSFIFLSSACTANFHFNTIHYFCLLSNLTCKSVGRDKQGQATNNVLHLKEHKILFPMEPARHEYVLESEPKGLIIFFVNMFSFVRNALLSLYF